MEQTLAWPLLLAQSGTYVVSIILKHLLHLHIVDISTIKISSCNFRTLYQYQYSKCHLLGGLKIPHAYYFHHVLLNTKPAYVAYCSSIWLSPPPSPFPMDDVTHRLPHGFRKGREEQQQDICTTVSDHVTDTAVQHYTTQCFSLSPLGVCTVCCLDFAPPPLQADLTAGERPFQPLSTSNEISLDYSQTFLDSTQSLKE